MTVLGLWYKSPVYTIISISYRKNGLSFTCSFADFYDVSTITFCGGFLIKNKGSKQILSLMSNIKKKKAIFLNYSEFAGALGALISK